MIYWITLIIAACLLVWVIANSNSFRVMIVAKPIKTILVLYAVLLPQILSYTYFPLPKTPFDGIISIVSFILFISGLFINMWARLTMNRYWGPPGQHNTKYQTKLITNGPFAYTRNPIYIGTVVLITGLSLAIRSKFFFLSIFLFLYFSYEVKIEEQLLHRIFGKDYDSYKKKVPRFL